MMEAKHMTSGARGKLYAVFDTSGLDVDSCY